MIGRKLNETHRQRAQAYALLNQALRDEDDSNYLKATTQATSIFNESNTILRQLIARCTEKEGMHPVAELIKEMMMHEKDKLRIIATMHTLKRHKTARQEEWAHRTNTTQDEANTQQNRNINTNSNGRMQQYRTPPPRSRVPLPTREELDGALGELIQQLEACVLAIQETMQSIHEELEGEEEEEEDDYELEPTT